MTEKLLVPDIGDFENVEVIELLVKEGQDIKKNDPVVTIESDKSSVEIPSIFSGKVESVNVKVGDKVSKGDLLINISSPWKGKSVAAMDGHVHLIYYRIYLFEIHRLNSS